MTRWDKERRQQEAEVDDSLHSMQNKLDSFKYFVEQKESAIHYLTRNVERCTSEMNRMQQNKDDFNERIDQEMEYLLRKVNSSHTDIEVRLAGLELKHNSLTDALWGEETGLTGLLAISGFLGKASGMFFWRLSSAFRRVFGQFVG